MLILLHIDFHSKKNSLAHTEFIAPLIKAIQELAERNNNLESTQLELIKQIGMLKAATKHAQEA